MDDSGPLVWVKDILLDILAIVGLALGGGQAAASGPLAILSQESMAETEPFKLTPAQAAVAVVKGHLDFGEGARQAGFSGLPTEHFRTLVEATGNPPGPETLMTMLNRQIIGDGEFAEGIREGLTKPKWTSQLHQLRARLMPTAELVAAVVQNQIDQGAAADMAARDGWNSLDFDLMVRTAGNPPGPTQLLEMWRRGIIDQGQVEQGLRESRLKNKWIPSFLQLQRRRVPMRTITTLLNHGAVSNDQALGMLTDLGYSSDDAAAIIAASHKEKVTTEHNVTVAQARQMYREHVVTREQATGLIQQAGYSAEAASELLTLDDAQTNHRLQQQTINNIRTRYVARKIDRMETSNTLDLLAVPPDQRDSLLALWDLQVEANHPLLTLAQLKAAYKAKVIDGDYAMARIVALGYDDEDAAIIGMTDGYTPNPNQGGTNA